MGAYGLPTPVSEQLARVPKARTVQQKHIAFGVSDPPNFSTSSGPGAGIPSSRWLYFLLLTHCQLPLLVNLESTPLNASSSLTSTHNQEIS